MWLLGYGLRCHRAIKEIALLLGIKDMRCKVHGPTTALSLIRATFQGLLSQVKRCFFHRVSETITARTEDITSLSFSYFEPFWANELSVNLLARMVLWWGGVVSGQCRRSWRASNLRPADVCVNKRLMTGPKGNGEFCSPEALSVEVEGKQNFLLPAGPVIKCFV